jgi:hypothetical protein
MFIITLITGIITGLIAITLLGRMTKNLPALTLLTVLTIITSMSLNNIYVISYVNAATYNFYLQRDDKVCRLLAIAYPDKFNAFIRKIKLIIRENKGKDSQLFFKMELINTIYSLVAPKATTMAITQYYQTEVGLYENLYYLDPELVLYMEFTKKYRTLLNPGAAVLLNGEENLNNLISKKEAVIESAILTPQPLITASQKERAAGLLRDILTFLGNHYGSDILATMTTDPTDPALDKRKAAAFIISFYKSILALKSDEVGIIFKYLYSGQNPSENRDETAPQT